VKHAVDGFAKLCTAALVNAAGVYPSPQIFIAAGLFAASFDFGKPLFVSQEIKILTAI
jgi:hypothetical protein